MLLAYSKIDLYDALLDSDVPEDPNLSAELSGTSHRRFRNASASRCARTASGARSWRPRW